MSGPADIRIPLVVRETLDAFATGLRQRFAARLRDLRLFGSYARGEAREDSDVDVLVVLDRVDREDDRHVTDLAADLIWELHGVVISPLVVSAPQLAEWKARERRLPLDIEREGLPL